MDYVLDASAVLALLNEEAGSQRVESLLSRSCISAVNQAEVYSKLSELGFSLEERAEMLLSLGIEVVAFDAFLAESVGELCASTRSLGLSLGDRSCLALARQLQAIALTADRAWINLKICAIECIR